MSKELLADITVKKTIEIFDLTHKSGVSIHVVVNLEDDLRTLNITPNVKNNDEFKFYKSDPDLISALADLFKEACNIADKVSR